MNHGLASQLAGGVNPGMDTLDSISGRVRLRGGLRGVVVADCMYSKKMLPQKTLLPNPTTINNTVNR